MKILVAAVMLAASNAFAGPCPRDLKPMYTESSRTWSCIKSPFSTCPAGQYFVKTPEGIIACGSGLKVPDVIVATPKCPDGMTQTEVGAYTFCGWKPGKDGNPPPEASCKGTPYANWGQLNGLWVCSLGKGSPRVKPPSFSLCAYGERVLSIMGMQLCAWGPPPKDPNP